MEDSSAKKRRASLARSPVKIKEGDSKSSTERPSAAINRNDCKAIGGKKKYKFAPINNLNDQSGPDHSVLRSISVSQIRNTKREECPDQRVKTKTTYKKSSMGELLSAPKPYKSSKNDFADEGPSEEVIWQYSPAKSIGQNFSDRDVRYNSPSDDNIEHVVRESSTPIVQNKFKSILSFSHIKAGEDSVSQQQSLTNKRNSIRQNSTIRSSTAKPVSRASARDIEDIINDIEGGFEIRPGFKPIDIPSSPTRIPAKGNDAEYDMHDRIQHQSANPSSDSVDGDDSLIEILTQKFGERNPNIPCKELGKGEDTPLSKDAAISAREPEDSSDDMMDNSLIDYLEEHNFTLKSENLKAELMEKEIVRVEERFSQNVKVKEDQALNEQEIGLLLKRANLSVERSGMTRLVILNVKDFNSGSMRRQKILLCKNRDGNTVSLVIRAPWVDLEFVTGDVVNTIDGQNFTNKRLFSDDKDPETKKMNDNLLVLNPDILISATSVGGSVECLRRSILNGKLSGPTEPSIPILLGNIVHELLQDCLRYKLTHFHITEEYIRSSLQSIIDSYSVDIIICHNSKKAIYDRVVTDHVPNIKQFIEKFVRNDNTQVYATVPGRRNQQAVAISNIIDIEENIWSPMYGLRGFIDVTVETQMNKTNKYLAPLEIKTGKAKSISHEAQGSIYTLLLKDRYEIPVNMFLLFYTKTNDFAKHDIMLGSIKHLLMLRNRMTTYLKHQLAEIKDASSYNFKLPSILASSSCDGCYSLQECMVLNKLCEEGTPEKSGLPIGEYDAITAHLLSNVRQYRDFYLKYDDLIAKEESSLSGMNKEIFLMNSKTRESLSGKCLGGLVIVESKEDSSNKNFLFTFARVNEEGDVPPMTNSQLSKSDMIIVSDESGHFALCTGHVLTISSSSITISTKRRIDINNSHASGFNRENRQVLKSVLAAPKSDSSSKTSQTVTYRIDRNEVQQGLALARYNLLNLFLPPVESDTNTSQLKAFKSSQGGDKKTRNLVVDNVPPKFQSDSEEPLIPYNPNLDSQFNEDQVNAIKKVFRAKDYALILGMPGTGKTTLIAEIIKELVAHGKTVLLTSYTHSAVDNILIKLKTSGIDILRLGNRHRVHQDAREFLPNFDKIDHYDQLEDQIQKPTVVATTCLGVHDIMLTSRQADFDYVILDEASQVSLPTALGPLRFASKFILVGDHYQLPPLVKNEAAKAGGLEVSLFKMLCERHPESVVELTYQYRMCGDIMTLSNYLIYDGKLKCGTEIVKNQKLEIPNIEELENFKEPLCSQDWLNEIMKSDRRVIFLDHDLCESLKEISDKDNIRNPGEAELVRQCVMAMVKCGVPRQDIGVMTLYRAQLRLLKKMFNSDEDKELEILTADQFQGRDKKCVIISMVRSNVELNGGSLLRELRRVNVAMTRSKSKLVIIGSKSTVGSIESLKGFIAMLQNQNWIYSLAKDCLDCYNIPETPSSQNRRRPSKDPHSFNKNITASSKFVRDKPVIRDTLNSM